MSAADGAWSEALAPAKVNPWLAVLGRRPDGYHEVDTGLLALDWCDRLRARVTRRKPGAGELELELSGPALTPDVPADERNLAWRAAAAVLAEARSRGQLPPELGLELALEKHVPSRAGLGGGSSDAAAAALAARVALGLPSKWEGLEPLCAALGSDTVFFARASESGFAHCTGRGERVDVLPAVNPDRFAVAVVTPAVFASTQVVYSALASGGVSCLPRSPGRPTVDRSFLDRPVDSIRERLFNDLETVALAAIPGLADWRELLDQNGAAHFRLSGSGSSFFGLFEDAESASRCLAEITSQARLRGLEGRGARVARPAGHGARALVSRS